MFFPIEKTSRPWSADVTAASFWMQILEYYRMFVFFRSDRKHLALVYRRLTALFGTQIQLIKLPQANMRRRPTLPNK